MKLIITHVSIVWLWAGLVVCSSGMLAAQDFTLQPGQNPAAVRDQVRAWRKANPQNANVQATVAVPPGDYFLTEPLVFSPEDSNVIWTAAKKAGGEAKFFRGRKIDGWKVNDKGWFVTQIDEVKNGSWYFESLFVNGKRATVARTPNENVPDGRRYFYVLESVETAPNRSFVPQDPQRALFAAIAKARSTQNPLSDVQIRFYHSWESSFHRIKSIDVENNIVELTGDARWKLDSWGPNLRYHVQGIESALDAPGEFLLKRDGTLTYIPKPGETLDNTTFEAPDGPKSFDQSGFLKIDGTPDNRVVGLQFVGLTFQCDTFNLPNEGLSCGQSAVTSPASVQVNYANDIVFEDCTVRNVGGYAFWFHQGCKNISVVHSLMEDLGAGGVRIGPGHGVDLSETNQTSDCRVVDCIIRGYGRIDAGGIGVWIGHSPNNSVLHNDISDGFYTGVSVGWIWGYRDSIAHDNHVDFNHIHHIGQGVLSDMGGVYTLGISPGTTVSNNRIHDVYSYNRYGRGGWGLYTDEGSSNIVMENNLVYRVHTGMFHQHYGKDNIVRNNILAFSIEEQIKRSRPEEHRSFAFERNIVVYDSSLDGQYLLNGAWKNPWSDVDNNVYWNYNAADGVTFQESTLEQWREFGKDAHSIIADPHFADPAHNDFRFTEASKPVLDKIGFKPFDFTCAGVLKTNSAWSKKAADYEYSEVVLTPDAPVIPLTLNDGFETPRMSPLRKVSYSGGGPEGYKIVEENGNKFLRIFDNAKYKYAFDPHFSYNTFRTEPGKATVEFDIRVGEGGNEMVEFRNQTNPYKTGPSLRIYQNNIQFCGQSCPIEPNVWTHVKIETPVGPETDGPRSWALTVRSGGKPEQKFTAQGTNPAWETFDALVFAALGTQETTIDLDNIEIR